MPPRRTSSTGVVLLFVSAIATVFVAGRIWEYSMRVEHLEDKLAKAAEVQHILLNKIQEASAALQNQAQPTACEEEKAKQPELMYYNTQPAAGVEIPELSGARIEDDITETVNTDEETEGGNPVLGQLDGVEDGYVQGWACQRGQVDVPIQVALYINDVKVGNVFAKGPAPHSLVNRICAGPPSLENGTLIATDVAFRFKLPTLPDGVYQIRGFAYHPDGRWRKELHLSPAKFVESSVQPGMMDTIRRKDDIIRARNAQIASLYEQLHTMGAWESATKVKRVHSFKPQDEEQGRLLVFIGVNSDPGDRHHRDYLRKTWVPTGSAVEKLQSEKGVMIKFIVGKSDWMDEKVVSDLKKEMDEFGDIMPVDIRGFEDAPKKVLGFLRGVALTIDADFFFKVEKDVVMNIDALVSFLEPRRKKGNLYMGCMKSGEVMTSARKRWYEPDHWRFGDAAGKEKKLTYHRHAHGQVYGLSNLVARYLAQNADVMHGFAHDDVTLGAWLLGLDVEYVDEKQFCCDEKKCASQTPEKKCMGFFDSTCSGMCRPDTRVLYLYKKCVEKVNSV